MPRQQFQDSMRLTKLSLECCGIYSHYPKPMTNLDQIKYCWFFLFNLQWVLTDNLAALFFCINGIIFGEDFLKVTISMSCFIYCALGTIKISWLFYHRRTVSELIDVLRKIYPGNIDDTDGLVKKCMNFLKIVVKVNVYLNYILITAYTISPLITMLYNYLHKGHTRLILPYFVVYPFTIDPYDKNIYPFVFLHHAYSGHVTVTSLLGPETLYYVFCGHVTMHFRLLQNYFRKCIQGSIGCVGGDTRRRLRDLISDSEEDSTGQSLLLGILIKRHLKLLQIVKRMDEVYSPITFGNIISSSLLICLTGFSTSAGISALWFQNLLFLINCLLQIFLICYFGEMIVESSAGISSALYNSEWYAADVRTKKTILLCMLRSQKPCYLTASKFSKVTVGAFSSILMSAWSYFTLLNSIFEEK